MKIILTAKELAAYKDTIQSAIDVVTAVTDKDLLVSAAEAFDEAHDAVYDKDGNATITVDSVKVIGILKAYTGFYKRATIPLAIMYQQGLKLKEVAMEAMVDVQTFLD